MPFLDYHARGSKAEKDFYLMATKVLKHGLSTEIYFEEQSLLYWIVWEVSEILNQTNRLSEKCFFQVEIVHNVSLYLRNFIFCISFCKTVVQQKDCRWERECHAIALVFDYVKTDKSINLQVFYQF